MGIYLLGTNLFLFLPPTLVIPILCCPVAWLFAALFKKCAVENVILNASTFTGINVGNAIINLSQDGTAFITSKPSATSIVITTTKGGFGSGDQIALATNNIITANVTSTTINSGIAVTNFIFEDRENELRRRIKLLKPQFIERIIRDFESKMASIDG